MARIDYTTLATSYHTLQYRPELLQLLQGCGVKDVENFNKFELHQKINRLLFRNYKGESDLKYRLAQSFRKKGFVAAFEVRAKSSRADFLVVNGTTKCFEIKSKVDTLNRLDKQINDYHEVFEYNTLVVDPKHIRSLESLLPEHVGIWTYEDDRKVELRQATLSPCLNPLAQLKIMTKKERQQQFGAPDPQMILSTFPSEKINAGLKLALKKRYADRWNFVNVYWRDILPIDLQFFFNTNVKPDIIYAG